MICMHAVVVCENVMRFANAHVTRYMFEINEPRSIVHSIEHV